METFELFHLTAPSLTVVLPFVYCICLLIPACFVTFCIVGNRQYRACPVRVAICLFILDQLLPSLPEQCLRL